MSSGNLAGRSGQYGCLVVGPRWLCRVGACGILAFAVGCGDDSSTTGSGSVSKTSDRRTVPKLEIDPTDQARARAMMVTLADVGPAWIYVADRKDDSGIVCGLDPNSVTVTGDSPNTHDTWAVSSRCCWRLRVSGSMPPRRMPCDRMIRSHEP